MINVYKLQYANKDAAISDLTQKGVLVEGEYKVPTLEHNGRTHAVVHLGAVQTGEDYSGQPIYSTFHHVDVMLDFKVNFGPAEILLNVGDPVAHIFPT